MVNQPELNKTLTFSVNESYREGDQMISNQVINLGSIQLWQLIHIADVREAFLKEVDQQLSEPPLVQERTKLISQFNHKISKYDPTAILIP